MEVQMPYILDACERQIRSERLPKNVTSCEKTPWRRGRIPYVGANFKGMVKLA